MDITDVASKIKQLKDKYNIHKVIIDGANKQAVVEIQKRHNTPLITADKRGKTDFIEIMNSELILARIKLLTQNCTPLIDEWQNLVWKAKAGKLVQPKVENPSCDNHLADAALYAWRHCYQYLGEAPRLKPKPNTPEWFAQEVSDMEQQAEEFFKAAEEAEKHGTEYL
jgi:hypothetical protein